MLFLNRCHNGSLVITIKRKRNKEGMFDILFTYEISPSKRKIYPASISQSQSSLSVFDVGNG